MIMVCLLKFFCEVKNSEKIDILINLMIVALIIIIAVLFYIIYKTMEHENELRVYQINLMYVLGYREKQVAVYEWMYSFTDYAICILISFISVPILVTAVMQLDTVAALTEQMGFNIQSVSCEITVACGIIILITLNALLNVRRNYKYYKRSS